MKTECLGTHLMLEKVAITVDTVNESTIRMYLRQGSGGWGGGRLGLPRVLKHEMVAGR